MLRGRFANNSLPSACAKVQGQFFDYLDGLLAGEERSQVQAHLDRCVACRQELANCRQVEAVLTSAPQALSSAGDLRPDFYARLQASQPSRSSRRSWWLAAPALAATLLCIVFLRPSREGITTAPVPNHAMESSDLGGGGSELSNAPPSSETAYGSSRPPESSLYAKVNVPSGKTEAVEARSSLSAQAQKRVAPLAASPALVETERLGIRIDHAIRLSKAAGVTEAPRSKSKAMVLLTRAFGRDEAKDLKSHFYREAETPINLHTLALAPAGRGGSALEPTSASLADKADALRYDIAMARGITLPIEQPVSPSTEEADEVHLRVSDEERGFVANARMSGRWREQPEGEVVTIEVDDETPTEE